MGRLLTFHKFRYEIHVSGLTGQTGQGAGERAREEEPRRPSLRARLLDHLVDAHQDRQRQVKSQCFGSLNVDY